MKKRLMRGLIIHLLMMIGIVVSLFPFFWLVMTAFKPSTEIFSYPMHIIPKKFALEHIKEVLSVMPLGIYYLNSSVVASVRVCSILFFCSLTGFVFAKLRFPGREIFFIIILATMMIPFQVRLVPLYLFFNKLGLLDTLRVLIIPGLMGPFEVFLMRQSIEFVPNELIDAARIDGSSTFRIFWQIVLPLSKPTLSALAIFTFMWSWSDFLWPIITITSVNKRTLEMGLAFFGNQYYTEYGTMMAGVLLSIIPIVGFFLVMQKQFIRGVALTGLKGV